MAIYLLNLPKQVDCRVVTLLAMTGQAGVALVPNYDKHLIFGSLVYTGLVIGLTKWHWMPMIVTLQVQTLASCLIGALFPDIDTKSKIQKYLYTMIMGAIIWLFASGMHYEAAALGTISLLPLIVRHRGIFHRIWFIGLICGTLNLLCYLHHPAWINTCYWNSIFFTAGAISHIWLDTSCTYLFGKQK